METVVMPGLITPKFAEVLAENPEILKTIIDHQSGEEVIMGQNCTLDCNCNSTNVKLVFCNVTIGIDNTADECNKHCSTGETEEKTDSCHIKIGGRDHDQEGSNWEKQVNELSQLKLEVAVLEARMEEAEKILRLIPRQNLNRKLLARCKRDIHEAEKQLTVRKKELECRSWLTEFWE